jgi:exodeoxyribonuclease V alpha subunit
VDAFGVETLRIIDEDPNKLRTVPGIGQKRVEQIRAAWSSQKAIQAIMLFLQAHGISVAQAVKIYKRYGDAAVAILRDNPYRLAEDIVGIAFKTADKIAMSLGIARDSPKRAQAGLFYTLERAATEGHVFAPRTELIKAASELLEITEERLEAPLQTLAQRGLITIDEDRVYTEALYLAETGTAHYLKRLISTAPEAVSIQVDKAIAWVEREKHIELSPEQREAIRIGAQAKVMVITGGPGTGKTTVLNSVLAIFEKKNLKVMLAAPTGRAAKRMEAATGHEAKTIHRLLEFSPKQGGFVRNEEDPLNVDLVVIDESSMVDIHLMQHLLKALKPQTRLFLVGDVDQLPSVGPGNVLLDTIASGVVPVVWLKTVFRQAALSGIIANAHRINAGQAPEFNTEDFFFVERKDPVKALETVVDLVSARMPAKFGLDPVRDIQVLAPMHRGECGVGRLNEALQAALNAKGAAVPRKDFRIGDKVMQLRNNYELDVYNGDVGIVTLVDEEAKESHVTFDDKVVLYEFEDLDELTLAYAATVHKAQGSEYPAVVMPVLTQHYLLLQRNVLYTSITRASKVVILVGDPKALRMALRNTDVTHRNTRLAERLRNTVS